MLLTLLHCTNPYLAEGKDAEFRLHYKNAETTLQLARQLPGNTEDERRAIHDLLARTLAAQGRMAEAQATYQELLVQDPLAPDPKEAAPKIRSLFFKAKRRLFPPRSMSMRLLRWDGWWAVSPRDPAESAEVVAFDDPGATLASLTIPAEVKSSAPPPLDAQAVPTRHGRLKVAAWAVLASSVVAAGAGIGLQVAAASGARAARSSPGPAEATTLYDKARANGVRANVLVPVGAAG